MLRPDRPCGSMAGMFSRLQFILRALLVAMLVVAAFFGGWFYGNKAALEARQALKSERESHDRTRNALSMEILEHEKARSELRKFELVDDPHAQTPVLP